MTMHDVRVLKGTTSLRRKHPAKHDLGNLDPRLLAGNLVVFTPTAAEVEQLVRNARRDLAGLTACGVVQRVAARNPDCLWAIARREHYRSSGSRGEGFVALLMLNEAGLGALVRGTFDASDPDPSFLTGQNEKPAGIYVWAIHAQGRLSAGVSLVLDKISTPLYRDADLYARAMTLDGHHFLEALGFERGLLLNGVLATHLHIYRRSPPPAADPPLYDGYRARSSEKALTVTLARSVEDLMRVMSVRSAVYIAEQSCPYAEEFDGNDLSASHLIGYVGDEPAGCLRIRYFADFAKIERLAVRREYRKTRLSFQLVRAAIELCRVKGYRRLYGHSQKRLVGFWSRFGFKTFEGGQELVFSDYDYVEMVLDAERHPQAISIGINPYVIIRPEGRWHLPGVLEHSTRRPVTRPAFEGVPA